MTPNGGPLLLYLQGAALDGLATDATGASNITNDEFSLFVQDQWQPRTNLTINYGLRWDAQLMPETVDPATTVYGSFLDDPTFPSDGTIPDQLAMFQPRGGVAWDLKSDGRSVLRASAGIYSARQNMLSQVGSVTTNGLQQQTLFANTGNFTQFGAPTPAWPGVLTPAPVAPGQFPLFSGVRVFHRDYKNPRIYTYNVGYEQEFAPDWSGYADFTWAEGTNLTRFLDFNRANPVCCDVDRHANRQQVRVHPAVGPAARRSHGGEQPRRVTLSWIDPRHPQALRQRVPVGSQLRARQGRGQRLERARPVHRSQPQLL